jgi:ATP synthase protein I
MNDDKLRRSIERQVDRERRAERDATTLIARTAYFGTIGLMLALPIVAGAYLGRWLDERSTGFSFSWTVSLIVIGVFIGAGNVVFFIRQTWS